VVSLVLTSAMAAVGTARAARAATVMMSLRIVSFGRCRQSTLIA
jgi:hypothetical protein